jgi:hypothetical protein
MTIRVPPSGKIARVSAVPQIQDEICGVRFIRQEYGDTTDLPPCVHGAGKMYIVSAMVRAANPGRYDIASPADMIRDEQGRIIGCRALEVNP